MLRSTNNSVRRQLKTKRVVRTNERTIAVSGGNSSPPGALNLVLYRLVFRTQRAVMLVFLLCLSFLLQPIYQASANTDVVSPEGQDESFMLESLPAEETISVSTEDDMNVALSLLLNEADESNDENHTEPTEQSIMLETELGEFATDEETLSLAVDTVFNDDTESEAGLIEISATSSDSFNEILEETSRAETGSEAPEGVVSGDDVESETSSNDSDTQSIHAEEQESQAGISAEENSFSSSTDSDLSDSVDTDWSATSTDEVTDSENLVSFNDEGLVSVVNSDSLHSFEKGECTKVDDGSFYCQKRTDEAQPQEGLFAAPDTDGDLEIFLVQDGIQTQITHNIVDDASPYYDEISNTIVWHRLINDRYQIVSYDVATGIETQVTNTKVNNMEPTQHAEYTVWQRWVQNNWQIILYDGNVEKQLTNSERHNIAPHIRGSLVIWNSRSNDGTQSLMTYDIQNRTYTTIADGEGVSVTNPRMVVLYEARYENGDVVMKGYDLVSGEIIDLEALPKPVPPEIPDADTTGETRALIQTKPTLKQSDVASSTDDALDSSSDFFDGELELSLDLRSASVTPEVFDEMIEILPVVEIPDLVIPPFEESASSSQAESE